MPPVRYRLSPEMIDAFDLYQSAGTDQYPFESDDLINYLNTGFLFTGEEEPTLAQLSGFFKKMVFNKDVSSDNIELVRKMLPGFGQTDIFCSAVFEDVEVGGIIDYMGFGKGFVFKSIKYYQIPSMLHSNNQWLMKALESKGMNQLRYVILSDGQLNVETYTPSTYDFRRFQDKLILFRDFLNDNRDKITNDKIFTNATGRS